MTVPTLMQNYQRQSYVTQLHKVYNEFSQALMQYQTDKNAVNLKEAGLSNQAGFDSFIKSYFKIVNDCGTDLEPCFVSAGEYKKLSGKAIDGWAYKGTRQHVVLASGVSIGYSYRPFGGVLYELYVDINGQKGPNIVGRDLFPMYIYNNGLIDEANLKDSTAPMSEDERDKEFDEECNGSGTWNGCFGKILNDNWQMTY